MAGTDDTSLSASISISSYSTALCIVPPLSACGHIDRLREMYDKAYDNWPPHINLIYPFVAPECLPRAQQQIQRYVDEQLDPSKSIAVEMDQVGHFDQRNNSTIFLRESQTTLDSHLSLLRKMALQALGQSYSTSDTHLTIGQSEDSTEASREFLLAKARLLPALNFRIGAFAILIRARVPGSESMYHMRLWGTIKIAPSGDAWVPQTPEYWTRHTSSTHPSVQFDEGKDIVLDDREGRGFNREVQPGVTFYFHPELEKWSACTGEELNEDASTTVTVSSYNVLIDSEYPPARDRDALLVRNILSDSAMSDILVLQEVSDDFLSYLLGDSEVQRRYPFTSHGPPSQPDIGPLPSLRNIVMLSNRYFTWNLVPFHRRHKGALVARFEGQPDSSASNLEDLVVAGVHLTCGLTDGSVAPKNVQLKNLTSYLTQHHRNEPWIIAGDFNITTSTYTIGTAIKNKSISSQTAGILSSIESEFADAGLLDAWSIARIEAADEVAINECDDLFEGENGATFDPRNNALAAATSGTSNNRPQRYDRILVRSQDTLCVIRFNHFGLPEEVEGRQVVASDHYGVRTTIQVLGDADDRAFDDRSLMEQLPIQHKRAVGRLSDLIALNTVLAAHGMFPHDEQVRQRKDAFALLKQVVLGTVSEGDLTIPDIPLVMVPVGSYALGVWTSESDIDCLCIGAISSKTFFKLARQRLLKAESQGVRILRKVEASTGTMLELSINGVAVDLQYCPAARVVEGWSEFCHLPASDPVFNLSMLSLRKLKPYRDLLYIQRTLPSLPAFRLAYRCIKLWAVERGIYSSRFGYLSGINITLMLSWVCKRITHDAGSVSPVDIVASFFHHYANIDWANEMVYDAFFHKKKPRYHRSAREPMVVLGFHAPNSNVAHTSTVPGLQTLITEFKIADERLSDASTTWPIFFHPLNVSPTPSSAPNGAVDFLKTYSSYVKINIQFWGRTLAKGKGLVGWVESRCLLLVVDIHKALPELGVRIWPARFADGDMNEGNDYQGCYLIGLSKVNSTTTYPKDDKQISRQSLDTVLDRFITQLKSDEKNYDPSICWIGISLARSSEVRELRLDDREWGDYAAEMEPDSDDDDEDSGDNVSNPNNNNLSQRTISQRPKPTSTPLSSTKLRPASDVLNRLRWDPSLDPADYIIGYEDRFLGARETSLEKWKSEQTDEEFIPQHRILYFKKRGGVGSDMGKGEVVWERATRIDKVFGSGAGDGGESSRVE
ncbi:Nn.00g052900.m01.CDS01 [Neocucurbitaria sp. VM-36]